MPILASRALACSVGGLLLCACGADNSGESGEPNTISLADGTQAEAQAVVDDAESKLVDSGTARYALSWLDGEQVEPVSTGAFDLSVPAYHHAYTTPEVAIEYRAKPGHLWTQIVGPEVAEDVAGCWMHYTTGGGKRGLAWAVPPAALMLIDPKAVGFREGSESEVVVDLLLDEAAPVMMPRIVNQLDGRIDPTATVRGVLTVRDGQYEALEFIGADVVEALEGEDLPTVLDVARDQLADLRIRVEYTHLGDLVEISEPDPSEIIELGSQRELLANGPDADLKIETCDANR